MPEYTIKTPHHNTTVTVDRYARDDRGDLKCFNEGVSAPVVDVPIEHLEGIFAAEALE